MKYTVMLEPQAEGGFTVQCVEIPGAISEGETHEKALANIKEAIIMVLFCPPGRMAGWFPSGIVRL